MKKALVVFAFALLPILYGHAESKETGEGSADKGTPMKEEDLPQGSIEAGKAKASMCISCHGPVGISSDETPNWPHLAGQSAPYTVAQLKAYRDGSRPDAVMRQLVQSMSDQDMDDMALYYESLPGAPGRPVDDQALIALGEQLYRTVGGGGEDGHACNHCHGDDGGGFPTPTRVPVPALKGQHAAYTAQTLRDYANNTRRSDGESYVMRDLMGLLSEDDIVAISAYLQGL